MRKFAMSGGAAAATDAMDRQGSGASKSEEANLMLSKWSH